MTIITKRRLEGVLLAAAIVCGTMAARGPAAALAKRLPVGQPGCVTSPNGYWSFYNYDSQQSTGVPTNDTNDPNWYIVCGVNVQQAVGATSGTVGNPITIVVGDNATPSSAYNLLYNAGVTWNNSPGPDVWLNSAPTGANGLPNTTYIFGALNLKTPPGCSTSPPYVVDYHVKTYGWAAPGITSSSPFYDPAWGNFVLLATHEDVNDEGSACGSSVKYGGWEEDASQQVYSKLLNSSGTPGNPNYGKIGGAQSCGAINMSYSYDNCVAFNNTATYSNDPYSTKTMCSALNDPSGTLLWSTANSPMGYVVPGSHTCIQSDGYAAFISEHS